MPEQGNLKKSLMFYQMIGEQKFLNEIFKVQQSEC